MQALRVVPKIFYFDTFKEFNEEFNIGKGDIMVTNQWMYDPYVKPLGVDIPVIYQEKYGKGEPQMIPVRNLAIGVIFKVILTFILTGIPAVNVKGAALGTVAAYATASVLNIIAVKRYTGASVDVMKTFGKPFLAALSMGAVVKLFHTIFCRLARRGRVGAAATTDRKSVV